MKTVSFLILLVLVFSCKAQTVKIIPLPMLTEIDSIIHDGRVSTYRTDYFLVKANSVNNDSLRIFVDNHLDSDFLKYNQYDMKFYKESESLNLEAIKRFKQKYKAVEDETPIITYSWFDGKLIVH